MVIGLTGQSGAGKSTVSQQFKNAGFLIIDCDIIAKNSSGPNSKGLSAIIKAFNNDKITYQKNGILNLDRKKLGQIVFSDSDKLELLNKTIHPIIIEEIKKEIEKNQNKLIILDAPTLFESDANLLCNLIISVIGNEKLRLERIKKRDKLTEDLILKRFYSQKKESFFIENSDYLIDNNYDFKKLKEQTEFIIDEIKNKNK